MICVQFKTYLDPGVASKKQKWSPQMLVVMSTLKLCCLKSWYSWRLCEWPAGNLSSTGTNTEILIHIPPGLSFSIPPSPWRTPPSSQLLRCHLGNGPLPTHPSLAPSSCVTFLRLSLACMDCQGSCSGLCPVPLNYCNPLFSLVTSRFAPLRSIPNVVITFSFPALCTDHLTPHCVFPHSFCFQGLPHFAPPNLYLLAYWDTNLCLHSAREGSFNCPPVHFSL